MSCTSVYNMTIEEVQALKAKRASRVGSPRHHHHQHSEQADRMVAAIAIAELSSSMSLPVSTFQPVTEIRTRDENGFRRVEVADERVVPTNSPIPTGAELANDWSIHDQDSNSLGKLDQNAGGSPAMAIRHVKLAVMPSRNRSDSNVIKRKMQPVVGGRGSGSDGTCSPPKLFCKDAGAEYGECFTERSTSPKYRTDYDSPTSRGFSPPSDVLNGIQGGRFVRTSAPVLVLEEHCPRLLDIPNTGSYKACASDAHIFNYQSESVPRTSFQTEVRVDRHNKQGKVSLEDHLKNSPIFESHQASRVRVPTVMPTMAPYPEMATSHRQMSGKINAGHPHASFYPQNNFPTASSQQHLSPQMFCPNTNAADSIHRRLFGDGICENVIRGSSFAPDSGVRKTSPTAGPVFNIPSGVSPALRRRDAMKNNGRVTEAFHGQYHGSLGRNVRPHASRGALQNMISSMPISFGDSCVPLEWGKSLSLPPLAFSSGKNFGSLKSLNDLAKDTNLPLNLHKYAGSRRSGSSGVGTLKRSTSFELEAINKGSYGVLGSLREYYEKLGSRKKVDLKNGPQKMENLDEPLSRPVHKSTLQKFYEAGTSYPSHPKNISWSGYEVMERADHRLLNADVRGTNDNCHVLDYSTSSKAASWERPAEINPTTDSQSTPTISTLDFVIKSEPVSPNRKDTTDCLPNSASSIPDSKLPPKKRKLLGYDHSQFSMPNSPVASPEDAEIEYGSEDQAAVQRNAERKFYSEQAVERVSPFSVRHSYPPAGSPQSAGRRLHPAVVPDEDGDMPIHIAVAQGANQVVEQLVTVMSELGVPLDSANNQRQTPLHLAVISDQYGLVKLLLTEGASPSVSDRKGRTSVHMAVRHSGINCLLCLLKYSTHPIDIDAMNYEGLTALHLAVQLGNSEAVRLLLSAGANINAADGKNGRTPLYYAAEENRLELAEMLLVNGAHPALPSYSGCTPLLAANARSHEKMVTLLERFGGVCDIDRAASGTKEHKNNMARFTGVKQVKLPSP